MFTFIAHSMSISRNAPTKLCNHKQRVVKDRKTKIDTFWQIRGLKFAAVHYIRRGMDLPKNPFSVIIYIYIYIYLVPSKAVFLHTEQKNCHLHLPLVCSQQIQSCTKNTFGNQSSRGLQYTNRCHA